MRRRRRSKVCLHPGRVFPPFFFFLADCRCDAKKNCNYRNTDRVPVALPSNGQGQMLMLVLMCVCVCVCVCMLLTERIRISCPPLATSSPPAASATSSANSRDSPPLVLHPIIPWFQCKKKNKTKKHRHRNDSQQDLLLERFYFVGVVFFFPDRLMTDTFTLN